jgi:hypothetical protein
MVDKDTEVGFLRVLRFLLTIFILPVAPQSSSSSSSSGAGKIGQYWPYCQLDSLTTDVIRKIKREYGREKMIDFAQN